MNDDSSDPQPRPQPQSHPHPLDNFWTCSFEVRTSSAAAEAREGGSPSSYSSSPSSLSLSPSPSPSPSSSPSPSPSPSTSCQPFDLCFHDGYRLDPHTTITLHLGPGQRVWLGPAPPPNAAPDVVFNAGWLACDEKNTEREKEEQEMEDGDSGAVQAQRTGTRRGPVQYAPPRLWFPSLMLAVMLAVAFLVVMDYLGRGLERRGHELGLGLGLGPGPIPEMERQEQELNQAVVVVQRLPLTDDWINITRNYMSVADYIMSSQAADSSSHKRCFEAENAARTFCERTRLALALSSASSTTTSKTKAIDNAKSRLIETCSVIEKEFSSILKRTLEAQGYFENEWWRNDAASVIRSSVNGLSWTLGIPEDWILGDPDEDADSYTYGFSYDYNHDDYDPDLEQPVLPPLPPWSSIRTANMSSRPILESLEGTVPLLTDLSSSIVKDLEELQVWLDSTAHLGEELLGTDWAAEAGVDMDVDVDMDATRGSNQAQDQAQAQAQAQAQDQQSGWTGRIMDIKDIIMGSTDGSRSESSSASITTSSTRPYDYDYGSDHNMWPQAREAHGDATAKLSYLRTAASQLDAALGLYRDGFLAPAQALQERVGDLLAGRGWTDELVLDVCHLLRHNGPATALVYRRHINNGTAAAAAASMGKDAEGAEGAEELFPYSPEDVVPSLIFQRRYYIALSVAEYRVLQAFGEEVRG